MRNKRMEPMRVGSLVTYRYHGERARFTATVRSIRDGIVELVGPSGYLTLHPMLHEVTKVKNPDE